MKLNADRYPVERMCRTLKISKSRYYAWLRRPESSRAAENVRVTGLIRDEFERSGSTYGSPRVAMSLRNAGVSVSRPRVARLMRKACLRSRVARRFVTTTDSRHGLEVSPNLLNRDFKPGRPGLAWVSDITYVRTGQGWLYLTVVIDLGDRKVVGWALGGSMHARNTVAAAWRMALVNRPPSKGLVFHSDRGVQYACKEFRDLLKAGCVRQSMSRKGDCWDNAVAESFFKSLKSEWLDHKEFRTREQAAGEVFMYIEAWYNRRRLHSALGYRSPEQFGRDLLKNTHAA